MVIQGLDWEYDFEDMPSLLSSESFDGEKFRQTCCCFRPNAFDFC